MSPTGIIQEIQREKERNRVMDDECWGGVNRVMWKGGRKKTRRMERE